MVSLQRASGFVEVQPPELTTPVKPTTITDCNHQGSIPAKHDSTDQRTRLAAAGDRKGRILPGDDQPERVWINASPLANGFSSPS